MTHTIHWLQLEIGYEANVPDTCLPKPKLQVELEKILRSEERMCWSRPGHTVIKDAPSSTDDDWVAAVLNTELNNALKAKGAIDVDVAIRTDEDVIISIPNEDKGDPVIKDKHTRCALRGDRWVNTRSYRISIKKNDGTYESLKLPNHMASAYLMATLTWECHPVAPAQPVVR